MRLRLRPDTVTPAVPFPESPGRGLERTLDLAGVLLEEVQRFLLQMQLLLLLDDVTR